MGSPPSFMVLPLCAERVTQIMEELATSIPCCRSRKKIHRPYVDDKANECNDFDHYSKVH